METNGTKMTYDVVEKREVAPDIANFTITIFEKGKTSKECIEKLNHKRTIAENYIKRLSTFESYEQTLFDVVKKITYKNGIVKNEIKEKIVGFNGTIIIKASLHITNSKEDIIKDTVNLFNMSVEQGFRCKYNITVSDDVFTTVSRELFVDCVNNGYTLVNGMADKMNSMIHMDNPVHLDSIVNYRYSLGDNNREFSTMKTKIGANRSFADEVEEYEPEEAINPEMIQALFDNKVPISCFMSLQFTL